MEYKRLLEIAQAFENFIEEELNEEDAKKWFIDYFEITEAEYTEIKED